MEKERLVTLVRAAQSGDEDALNSLYSTYYGELRYIAYKTIKDLDMAEDIVQEAFLEIITNLDSLQDPAAFAVWAKKITYNKCVHYLNAERESVVEEFADGSTIFDELVEDNQSRIPDEAFDKANFQKTVLSFLDQLPKEQRTAVIMHYFQELSIDQIAKRQGTTAQTVENRLKYARKAIRSSVEAYEKANDVTLYNSHAKKIYDVYVSCSPKDRAFADQLIKSLKMGHISVWHAPDSLSAGSNFRDSVTDAISCSRILVPIITDASLSGAFRMELEKMLTVAANRSKEIIPVCYRPDVLRDTEELSALLAPYQWIVAQGDDPQSVAMVAERIRNAVVHKNTDAVLYGKLSEYIRTGLNDQATQVLCQLIQQLCKEIVNQSQTQRISSYLTLISYLEKIADLYDHDYGKTAVKLAHQKLEAIDLVAQLLGTDDFQDGDLYHISIAIRLIYLDREIRLDCADAITGGDVSQGIVRTLPEKDYAEKQARYVARYHDLLKRNDGRFTDSQMQFILATEQYIYKKAEKTAAPRPVQTVQTPEDELLQAVAAFTREGNKIFDLISEKQPARDFLQCLITSYERLKSYCEVVGAKEICLECIDRIAELKTKMIQTSEEEKATEKSENGIKTLLGLTVPKSGKYDVFISHKHEDYDIALEMYEFLRRNLKEPFFDKHSLPQMSKANYRASIMAALDGSRHFVVVLSDLAYLESDWVSLEMSIFQAEIDEGRKPDANFLMVVTNDVYKQIMASNKSVLPIDYRRCEIIKLEDYKDIVLNYLNN